MSSGDKPGNAIGFGKWNSGGSIGYGRDKDCGFWTPSVKKFGGKKRVKAVVMTKYGFLTPTEQKEHPGSHSVRLQGLDVQASFSKSCNACRINFSRILVNSSIPKIERILSLITSTDTTLFSLEGSSLPICKTFLKIECAS